MNKIARIALIICIIGIIVFVIGATTGTITGYQGADGKYYSYPDAVGSNEWMCMPGFLMAIGGGFVYKSTKNINNDGSNDGSK